MLLGVVLALALQDEPKSFVLAPHSTQTPLEDNKSVLCTWFKNQWTCTPLGIANQPVTVNTMNKMGTHLMWVGLTGSADLFTTAWGLKRCPVCAEGNPLGFDAESRIALKSAWFMATTATLWKMEAGGHSKAAKRLRWTVVLINTALVGNNLYHGIQKR